MKFLPLLIALGLFVACADDSEAPVDETDYCPTTAYAVPNCASAKTPPIPS